MGAVRTPLSGAGPSGSASGWPSANASSPPCAVSFVRSALRTDVGSFPPQGSPIGAGVGVRCGGLCSPSAPTAGASRCGWVGGVGGSAPSSPAAVPPGRGLPPRVAARVGPPGPRAAGHPPGRRCVADPGRGLGRGPGGREMTVLSVVPVVWLVGRGAAGAPTRHALWPVGPSCRTLPKPGGLGPRWGRGCGGAGRRKAGRWWRRSG